MSVSLSQTLTAVGPGISSSFQATGGTSPYVFSVLPNGAGGTINSSTGVYTAPATASSFPTSMYDTILATDSAGLQAYAKILVANPLILFCDIIQTVLHLDSQHCYLWDQKIMQPTDSGLYVAVAVQSCKPFGSSNQLDANGNSVQSVNMLATLQLDVISRGPAARDQKELVILALNSDYAISQQYANGFYIGKIPPGSQFTNISSIDGAAIPYRFAISVNMQYAVSTTNAVPYYSSFVNPTVVANP